MAKFTPTDVQVALEKTYGLEIMPQDGIFIQRNRGTVWNGPNVAVREVTERLEGKKVTIEGGKDVFLLEPLEIVGSVALPNLMNGEKIRVGSFEVNDLEKGTRVTQKYLIVAEAFCETLAAYLNNASQTNMSLSNQVKWSFEQMFGLKTMESIFVFTGDGKVQGCISTQIKHETKLLDQGSLALGDGTEAIFDAPVKLEGKLILPDPTKGELIQTGGFKIAQNKGIEEKSYQYLIVAEGFYDTMSEKLQEQLDEKEKQSLEQEPKKEAKLFEAESLWNVVKEFFRELFGLND